MPGFNRRAVKKGRPRIEDRAHTIEGRQPWLTLGMSRRTWYRRQAEKRAGGELGRQKQCLNRTHG